MNSSKVNVKPCRFNALEELSKVEIVEFNYQNDNKLKLGYLTDRVNEPFTDPSHEKFEQGNCIALLIKAVNELSSRLYMLEHTNSKEIANLPKGGEEIES